MGKSMIGYGFGINIGRIVTKTNPRRQRIVWDYFGAMFNGRMFAFSRGHLTRQWAFTWWDNIWRKTQTKYVPLRGREHV